MIIDRVEHFFQWILEFLLVIFHGPLSILNYVLPFHHKKQTHKKGTIILVERWFRRNPLHFLMKYYLENRGFETHSINLPLLKDGFKESAHDLKIFLDTIPGNDLILVGISGGGLTCLEYLSEESAWKRVKLFIAVGAPFKGAVAGFLMPFSKPRSELINDSKYSRELLKKPILHKDRIICIAAVSDQMVGHDNSLLPGTRHVIINVVGHNLIHTIWLPTWKKIFELASEA
jgi:hypothetical protein